MAQAIDMSRLSKHLHLGRDTTNDCTCGTTLGATSWTTCWILQRLDRRVSEDSEAAVGTSPCRANTLHGQDSLGRGQPTDD